MAWTSPQRLAITAGTGIRTQDVLSLILNNPPDLVALGALLADKDDLSLVWHDAKIPFDREQWHERFSSRAGNRSFFVANDGDIIGHAALLETDEPGRLMVSHLFIRPDQRGHGFGRELIALLEAEAKKTAGTRELVLRVRTYHPRAARVYESAGFVKSHQDGTLVIMRKALAQ